MTEQTHRVVHAVGHPEEHVVAGDDTPQQPLAPLEVKLNGVARRTGRPNCGLVDRYDVEPLVARRPVQRGVELGLQASTMQSVITCVVNGTA